MCKIWLKTIFKLPRRNLRPVKHHRFFDNTDWKLFIDVLYNILTKALRSQQCCNVKFNKTTGSIMRQQMG